LSDVPRRVVPCREWPHLRRGRQRTASRKMVGRVQVFLTRSSAKSLIPSTQLRSTVQDSGYRLPARSYKLAGEKSGRKIEPWVVRYFALYYP